MVTSGNTDSQLASRSVLNDFKDDAFSISAGSFFPKCDNPNAKSALVMVDKKPLYVELLGVVA